MTPDQDGPRPERKKRKGEIENLPAYVQNLEQELAGRAIREKLSRSSEIWMEEYSVPGLDGKKPILAGVAAHFGRRIPREEMDAFIQPILDERSPKENGLKEKPVGYDHGFGAIWRTPDDYTQEEIDNDTFETALRLAKRTLAIKGWSAQDIDVIDFANSAAAKGMSEKLRQKLLEELGIREDVKVKGTFLACDGAGNALYERLNDPTTPKGTKVLLLSIDQVTSEMPLDKDKVDPLTMQLFSNGAAALAYEAGEDLKLLVGTTEVYEDTSRTLTANPRYAADIKAIDALPEEVRQELIRDGILYKIGENEWAIKMPTPDQGMKGRMDGRHTAQFFWQGGLKTIKQTDKNYKDKEGLDAKPVNYATGHQPAYETLVGMIRQLFDLGKVPGEEIHVPIEWVVPDGNSSGATSLIAFLRNISKYKPGDRIFYVSYGAGGSFTSFIFEVGGKNSDTSAETESLAAA